MVESDHLSLNKSQLTMFPDLGKLFTQWSDDEEADPERTNLLRQYDRMNRKSNTKRPAYPPGQPEFHENNRTFMEAFCPCCVLDN